MFQPTSIPLSQFILFASTLNQKPFYCFKLKAHFDKFNSLFSFALLYKWLRASNNPHSISLPTPRVLLTMKHLPYSNLSKLEYHTRKDTIK